VVSLNRDRRVDAQAAASLAQHLGDLAASLPAGERAVLSAMVEAAMQPLDRVAMRDPREVLSDEELHAFAALLGGGEGSR
jgi:hypothetical protein